MTPKARPRSEPRIPEDDVREGMTAVISVKIPQPQFECLTCRPMCQG